ncbi:phospholipid-lipopolysaccharide ABC transporter [Rhodopseudomonas palustris]|uniref:ABC transporter ATP-binding protein n=1 Tax=Rhodopseudomonas palustris TaxID=1076 RepID=UPI000D204147|nr:ABC transporter ATP-binding protein [Rhodopseudomonas palustris]AVT78133.1 phospholipid-lipopolysaccharide ABC transporter [Rhodopseudomonas palustris]
MIESFYRASSIRKARGGTVGQLLRLWGHLTPRRRWQFGLLLVFMLVGAVMEVISLGAVLPFLGALADPDGPTTRAAMSRLTAWTGVDPGNPILFLTILFAVTALVAGGMRLVLLRASTWLTFNAGADLSMEIFRRTLYQPYAVHVARNSAELISGITVKTNSVMFDVLLPSLTLLNSSVVLIFMVAALIAIDPVIALGSAVVFAGCYVLLASQTHIRLAADSQVISREQVNALKALQEGLGGIRDVLVNGTQTFFCQQYRGADLAVRQAQARNLFTSGSPRYVMESLGMATIALLALYLYSRGGLTAALPTLGALALGVQRMLPAFQQGYNSWSLIMGHQATLEDALALLDQPMPRGDSLRERLPFHKELRLDHVKFRYSSVQDWVLDIESLSIRRGARVGIIGTTGSGKSTLLDLIMGLLPPSEGKIWIDETEVTEDNVVAWRRSVAHVSQSLYLADSTIAENIAFGVPRHEIDRGRVSRAAEMAQIAGFIDGLSEGFDTMVGEQGVRLSGGQRQRIGIARALYKDATVLALDEATSALDNETEAAVMESIDALDRDMTLLIVAHRMSTLRGCDIVLSLENGRVTRVIADRAKIAEFGTPPIALAKS